MLRAHDLHAYYGKSHVLQGVSLDVARGEIVALLGRNGVGKSTTLKALMGLIPVREGRVELQVDGRWRDVTRTPAYIHAALGFGYVPEDRRIFPYLTVEENLHVGLDRAVRSRTARAQILARVLSRFPALQEKRKVPGRFLSGGQQQMLAVARVLVTGPRIILLDEPSQGLSPRLAESLMEVIRQLALDGIGVLLVEQNAIAVLGISTRAYIMDKGSVCYAGATRALRGEPQTLQRFLGVG